MDNLKKIKRVTIITRNPNLEVKNFCLKMIQKHDKNQKKKDIQRSFLF